MCGTKIEFFKNNFFEKGLKLRINWNLIVDCDPCYPNLIRIEPNLDLIFKPKIRTNVT